MGVVISTLPSLGTVFVMGAKTRAGLSLTRLHLYGIVYAVATRYVVPVSQYLSVR
jgi:hypothetical protein